MKITYMVPIGTMEVHQQGVMSDGTVFIRIQDNNLPPADADKVWINNYSANQVQQVSKGSTATPLKLQLVPDNT